MSGEKLNFSSIPEEEVDNLGANPGEEGVEQSAEHLKEVEKELGQKGMDSFTAEEIEELKAKLDANVQALKAEEERIKASGEDPSKSFAEYEAELEKLKAEEAELDSEEEGSDASTGETGEKHISPEEARATIEKAKKNAGLKALIVALIIALLASGMSIVHLVRNNNAAATQETTVAAAQAENPDGDSSIKPVTPGELNDIDQGAGEKEHDFYTVMGGVDYDGDGLRDLNINGIEIQWESTMDKADEARHEDLETAFDFYGDKMLSGGLGSRLIDFEHMDEHRNFTEGALEMWSNRTLESARNNIPSTIMAELITHGTVMNEAIIREDGTVINLSEYLAMLESDEEFAGKWQNQIAQEQHEIFDKGTVETGRTPNQYYSIQIAIDKTTAEPRMHVVIVDTDKLEGEDLQNESRQWVDLRREDGTMLFDDSESLEKFIVASLGLPEGTKLVVHSDNSGGYQFCAWEEDDEERPGPQDEPITIVDDTDPGTGTEGTGTEGTGTEGTGTEGTGTEGTGTEGTGTEGTGSETSDWGKGDNPHAGQNVDVSDPVNPASEVSRSESEGANRGNQGYVNDNQATPGSHSGNNGGSGNTGVTAPGTNSGGDRLTGGNNQGGNQQAGTNNSAPAVTPEATNKDNTGNNNQGAAQNSGTTTGGNNYSDSQEEDLVNNGDF